MNARKAVEPVCLDFIVKWRGDEETGRDQMDEILREVVIITDSEESDESSEEDDSSDEEGEITSSSSESISEPASRNQNRSAVDPNQFPEPGMAGQHRHVMQMGITALDDVSLSDEQPKANGQVQRDKRVQRGFKRYQAAWDDAVHRQHAPETAQTVTAFEDPRARIRQKPIAPPIRNQYGTPTTEEPRSATYGAPEHARLTASVHDRRPVSSSYSLSQLVIQCRGKFRSRTNSSRNLATYNKEQL